MELVLLITKNCLQENVRTYYKIINVKADIERRLTTELTSVAHINTQYKAKVTTYISETKCRKRESLAVFKETSLDSGQLF